MTCVIISESFTQIVCSSYVLFQLFFYSITKSGSARFAWTRHPQVIGLLLCYPKPLLTAVPLSVNPKLFKTNRHTMTHVNVRPTLTGSRWKALEWRSESLPCSVLLPSLHVTLEFPWNWGVTSSCQFDVIRVLNFSVARRQRQRYFPFFAQQQEETWGIGTSKSSIICKLNEMPKSSLAKCACQVLTRH